jgi:hypothetical protein
MRDRTIDAARASAIVGVVVGHWLVTGLVAGPDGVTTASPLSAMPALAPATWFLQTLGLLFFAGGYAATRRPAPRTRHPAHYTRSLASCTRSLALRTRSLPSRAQTLALRTRSLPSGAHSLASRARSMPSRARRSARRDRRSASAGSPTPRRRVAGSGAARLTWQALALLAGWALILLAAAALGMPTATLHTIAHLVVSPLWFLAPYLLLRAATGPLRRVLDRVGAAAVLPLIAVVAAGDLGFLPWPIVLPAAWAIPWLLGMLLAGKDEAHSLIADHRQDPISHQSLASDQDPAGRQGPAARLWAVGTWAGAALALGGATSLMALVLLAGYPVSAVGVPGDGRSNLAPPSLAAVALAVTQIGVFLLLRRPLARLLQHDRVWRPVTALTGVAVPVYLLHQSVLLAVAGGAALVDPTMPGLLTAPDGPEWAWQRLVWVPVLGGALAFLVRGRHYGESDYLRPGLRGTIFDGSRARTTSGGDRCAR